MFFLYYKLPHFEYIAVWIVAFGKIAKWYHFTNFLLKVTCFPTSIKISVLVWLTAKYVSLQREFHCETRFPAKRVSPRWPRISRKTSFFTYTHMPPNQPTPPKPPRNQHNNTQIQTARTHSHTPAQEIHAANNIPTF